MSDSLLADAVDIRRWLEEDAGESYDTRLSRDRNIGRTIETNDRLERVRAWWQAVGGAGDADAGARLVGLRRVLTGLLVLLGAVIGLGVAAAALAYEGDHPVNLLMLLGALVGLPAVLLVFTLLLLLPGRIPGLAAVREGLAVLNPARWACVWLDRLAGIDLFAGFGGLRSTSGRGQGAFARWQLVVLSQWFVVGFFLGAIALIWLRIVFTDVAFGWSSTLELTPETVHALFSALAAPWADWLPAASVDAALVEASRFNRLESVPIGSERAVLLGSWWPFVLMCVACYGLLPRLLLLLVGLSRLRGAIRSMLLGEPEVLALLDRLARGQVGFEQVDEEAPESGAGNRAQPPPSGAAGNTAFLIWNEAAAEEAVLEWGRKFLEAQGPVVSCSIWQDGPARASELAVLPDAVERLVLVTKGWEPPLLEFTDFLTELRGHLGQGTTIVVVPLGTRGVAVQEADREVWARALGRHDDAGLYVMPAVGEDAA
jgi:hypothetical protein